MSEFPPIKEAQEQEPTEAQHERRPEMSPEQLKNLENELRHSGERARQEAHQNAISGRERVKTDSSDRHDEPVTISKMTYEHSYRQTMRHIQKELPPASRAFSKIIHSPVVEKTSDVLGATVARPTSLLSGGLCAFLVTLAAYVYAKHNGFSLSGFETIASFAVGWILGLLVDAWRGTGRKKR